MRKIDNFTNCYSQSKTVCFKAIPVGQTEQMLKENNVIENEIALNEMINETKGYMDRYHKEVFMNKVLNSLSLDLSKTDEELKEDIVKAFISNPDYKNIDSAKFLTRVLPEYLEDEKELETVASIKNFYTAFYDYKTNRATMYKDSIPKRLIDDNLAAYKRNMKVFEKVRDYLDVKELSGITDYLFHDDSLTLYSLIIISTTNNT